MNTWKVVLATLVIFVAGIFTGAALVARAQHLRDRPRLWPQPVNVARPPVVNPPVANPTQPGEPRPQQGAYPNFPQQARIELLRRIEREMTLTSGQREKIEAIIRDGQERTREIMQPVQPQLAREMRATQERIREILTEDQRARFDELMKQRPQRRPDDQSQPDRRNRELRRPLPQQDSNGEPSRPEGQPPQREN